MRRNEGHCPCGECKPFQKYNPAVGKGIRDCPATDEELALLAKARRTTDPRKLAAIVPAWLKRALTPMPKPFVYVPDKVPVYPGWTKRRSDIGVALRPL